MIIIVDVNIDKDLEKIDISITKLKQDMENYKKKIKISENKVKHHTNLLQKSKTLLDEQKTIYADKERAVQSLEALKFYKYLQKENVSTESLNINKTISLLKRFEGDIKKDESSTPLENNDVENQSADNNFNEDNNL